MKNDKILASIEEILKIGPPFFEKDSYLQKKDICAQYMHEIGDELDEARAEFKKDNAVHFEDELGDIFWDYIMLLQTLERGGYIRSVENVFAHAAEKFTQRLGFIHLDEKVDTEKYWNDVKKKQKEQLKKEHNALYGES